jgi:hypothetical protein
MSKISENRKIKDYYKIFEVIREYPTLPIHDIAAQARLSRNTTSKYLREMYERTILLGPCIRMKSSPDYKEYIYLINFSDPHEVFRKLEGFPHVLYRAMSFGDWNTLIITDKLMDPSKLVGFETLLHKGVKYSSYTLHNEFTSWDEYFVQAYDELVEFKPALTEEKIRELSPSLSWSEDDWKLFHAFKNNLRTKVTPTLNKIKVRYEAYSKWHKNYLKNCTIHTGFYPHGYDTYSSHCLLMYSDYEQTVKSLFASFPTTPYIMESGKELLLFINTNTPHINRALICLLYDMKTKGIIRKFHHAVVMYYQ